MKIFDQLFRKEIDQQADREGVNQVSNYDKSAFTYGEIVFDTFVPLLSMANPKAGDLFYDLGCGTGKPLIAAALSFPNFKHCKGMELVDGLVQTG